MYTVLYIIYVRFNYIHLSIYIYLCGLINGSIKFFKIKLDDNDFAFIFLLKVEFHCSL